MEFSTFVFYAFATLLLGGGVGVILARNPVHAALFLVLAFFSGSGLWMLLEAEFLAISLVLVYVGAVMVLFLFVVMMLDINIDSIRQGFWKHFPLAATVGAVIALELAAVLLGGFRISEPRQQVAAQIISPASVTAAPALDAASAAEVGHVVVAQVSNTKALGILLYTEYLYPVQVAALILFVALIAAIALTLRARKDSKFQDAGEQARVKARDRVTLIKMDAVKPEIKA
jgi:NADH-quinone oxidoreductase subunit J